MQYTITREKIGMNLLVLEKSATDIKKELGPKFPEVNIHAAHNEMEAEPFIDSTEALFTFKISDDLISKAPKLKWIAGASDIYIEQALPIIEENLKRFLGGERWDLINYIER